MKSQLQNIEMGSGKGEQYWAIFFSTVGTIDYKVEGTNYYRSSAVTERGN